MCNNNSDSCSKMSEILGIINVLQQNSCNAETCLDTCDRGFLGCGVTNLLCNTRPVVLYLNNGNEVSMPTTKTVTTCPGDTCSSVFRVEKIEDCVCTFRVLAPAAEGAEYPYVSTNSFFTMNLNCLCCLRCLQDTYVEGI